MAFNTVIFDLDGTLLDTLSDIADSVNAVLEKNGYKTHTVDEIRTFIGHGASNLLVQALPQDITKSQFNKVMSDYLVHYALHKNDSTQPFEGIMELLKELYDRKIKLAILSNKQDLATKQLAEEVFKHYILYAKGQTNDMPAKPCAHGVYHILKIIDSIPEECIFVGDSDVDIQTGKNAGIFTVGVSWGFRTTEELVQNGADKIVSSPKEILELF